MSIAERLMWARKRAGIATPTDAARRFGWTVSTYLGHENGDRNPSRKAAEKYGRAFRVSWSWILTGEGSPTKRNIVPVWGHVGLGEAITLFEGASHGPLDEIELPIGFAGANCGALIAKGNSQFPRVKEGEVIIFERNSHAPADLIGQEVVLQVLDGPVLLKTIRKGTELGLYNLESHNAPVIENQPIEWVGEVLAIIPKGKWKSII